MSQSNADWDVNREVADHAIELTEEGRRQARECGKFLAEYVDAHVIRSTTGVDEIALTIAGSGAPRRRAVLPKIRLWLSPYTRTRQTADEIAAVSTLVRPVSVGIDVASPGQRLETRDPGASIFLDRREHLLLAEQQFGIFDGLSDEEREAKYPDAHAYYEKCKRHEGKLWPKMPLGESRFEVCQRVHQAFGTFHRDARRHRIDNIVVVGHGTTNRAFVMMWCHLPYEWMHQEPNPRNCSVRLIEDGEDRGYIFDGFGDPPGYRHSVNKETEE